MKRFLNFETFITPVFLKWYWIVSTAVMLVIGIQRAMIGFKYIGYSEQSFIWQGLGIALVLPFVNRVLCEVIISIVKPAQGNKSNTESNT